MSDIICASCGIKNPAGTPKCRCGRVLPPPTVPPPTPLGTPTPPDKLIPKTEIRRINPGQPQPQAPAEGFSLPKAGRSEQSYTPVNTPLPKRDGTPTPARVTPGSRSFMSGGADYFFKSVAAILFLALLAVVLGFALFQRFFASKPQLVVPRLAEQYLNALSQNDFMTAYAMLSPQAQAQSSIDEFRQLRDTTPWTWSNIEIKTTEPDAMLVQYDLALQGRPPQKDYLLFVKQGERWVRPYTWGLVRKAELAFDRGDADMAALVSQAATTVDPRDPMARGYLCEALYYRKLADAAERECRTAVELASKYPSKLTPKSLYHLHAILGDTYKNSLKRYDQAIQEYALMLDFPSLSADDQCELLLARADTFVQMSRPNDVKVDLVKAEGVCAKPEDRAFIAKKRAELEAR